MRFWEIDFLRGIAILMMVVFHFLWDLNYFKIVEISLYTGFFGLFQKSIAVLFLLIVGVILVISYNKDKKEFWRQSISRGIFLAIIAFSITALTLVAFPKQFIYFGILHLISLSILFSIYTIRMKVFNLFFGILLLILPFFQIHKLGIYELNFFGIGTPLASLDFYPIIPWYGVVLIGLFLGHYFYPDNQPKIKKLADPNSFFTNKIQFLGKHSLIIYLVHQAVLFPLVFALSMVI